MDLTVLTCNYNTPELIVNLQKSLHKFHPETDLYVIDTSKEYNLLNTSGSAVTSFRYNNASHGPAVNLGLSKIQTQYCLLVDSDILFLSPIDKLFDKIQKGNYASAGKLAAQCAGKSLFPRIEPWFNFINLELIKRSNILYFDQIRTKQSKIKNTTLYDIGSTFYEDLGKNNLTVAEFNGEGKYFYHAGGLSWHVAKYDPTKPDTDIDFGGTHPHKALYDIGCKRREIYNDIVKSILT
jgi:glycosyltransferase involved in cell wall biosynthesis